MINLADLSRSVQGLNADSRIQLDTSGAPTIKTTSFLGRIWNAITRSGEEKQTNTNTIRSVISTLKQLGGDVLSPETEHYLNGLAEQGKPLSVRRFTAIMNEAAPAIAQAQATAKRQTRQVFERMGFNSPAQVNDFLDKFSELNTTHGTSFNRINALLLGGGNLSFVTVFQHPALLSRDAVGQEGVEAITDEMAEHASNILFNLDSAQTVGKSKAEIKALIMEMLTNPDKLAEVMSNPGSNLQFYGSVVAEVMTIQSTVQFLTDPSYADVRQQAGDFIRDCHTKGFNVDQAMAVVRGGEGKPIDTEAHKAIVQRAFGDGVVTYSEGQDMKMLYVPPRSS